MGIANSPIILGITLRKRIPQFIGEDAFDSSGKCHLGIITIQVSILKGSQENLRKLREELYTNYFYLKIDRI